MSGYLVNSVREPSEYPASIHPLIPAQVLAFTQGEQRSCQPHYCDLWLLSSRADLLDLEILKCVLSPADRGHVARFRFEKDQLRSIVARGGLRRILSCYCAVPPDALEFRTEAYGKPVLANSPVPLAFNVSHSGDCVLIGVTSGASCGVDIEHSGASALAREGIEDVLCPREIQWLRQNANGFLRLWTTKEAIMKAIGLGLSVPFSAIDVTDILQGESSFMTSQLPGSEPQTLSVHEIFLVPDYTVAVATRDETAIRIVTDSHLP
jgi:4'-phosphopantetheinyl transferase